MQFLRKLNRRKKGICIIVPAVLFTAVLTLFLADTESDAGNGGSPGADGGVSAYESGFKITETDLNTDASGAVRVDLSETSGEYIIREGGSYLLTGNLRGCIYIDAGEQIVHLIFDDVSIDASSGPAISVASAAKVVITLEDGSVNTLKDASAYGAGVTGGENACIYSTCDLTVNGNGVLNVYGYFKDAVHGKDIVKVLGGEIHIQAKRDGIRGNDGILIRTDVNIESEKSGLHTTKTKNNGAVEITGGSVSIISGTHAVESAGDFYAGNCHIYGKGILSNVNIGGNTIIQEGCWENGQIQT